MDQTGIWGSALAAGLLFFSIVSLLGHRHDFYAVPVMLVMAALVPAMVGTLQVIDSLKRTGPKAHLVSHSRARALPAQRHSQDERAQLQLTSRLRIDCFCGYVSFLLPQSADMTDAMYVELC